MYEGLWRCMRVCGGVRIRIVEVYFGVSDQNLYGNTPPGTPPVYRPTVQANQFHLKINHV